MSIYQRYVNQIKTLVKIARQMHEDFKAKKPLDQQLTLLFRSNKKYGSKDRKLISNTIFGYYRWYGWLRWLEDEQFELGLLLGYLLDENPFNDVVDYWCDQLILPKEFLDLFKAREIPLRRKFEIVNRIIMEAEMDNLFPEQALHLPQDTLESFQERAALWVRLERFNTKSFFEFLEQNEAIYSRYDNLPNALEIYTPLNLNLSEDFKLGLVEIQDASSQMVGLTCDPKPGQFWVDLCAGSGGKALHLMSLMEDAGEVIALEIRESIFKNLKTRIQKGVHQDIQPLMWDGDQIPEFNRTPDGVLVDAPCTCSGTWRRAPDQKWHLTAESIATYAATQLSLLEKGASLLKKGGRLVYATCSFIDEENFGVISRFLEKNPDFSIEELVHPADQSTQTQGLLLLPPKVNGNAMYIASLIKK